MKILGNRSGAESQGRPARRGIDDRPIDRSSHVTKGVSESEFGAGQLRRTGERKTVRHCVTEINGPPIDCSIGRTVVINNASLRGWSRKGAAATTAIALVLETVYKIPLYESLGGILIYLINSIHS
ncbi:MAG: hypothetical protein ACJ8AH_03825 [Stellaceae bacterium]